MNAIHNPQQRMAMFRNNFIRFKSMYEKYTTMLNKSKSFSLHATVFEFYNVPYDIDLASQVNSVPNTILRLESFDSTRTDPNDISEFMSDLLTTYEEMFVFFREKNVTPISCEHFFNSYVLPCDRDMAATLCSMIKQREWYPNF